MGDVYIAPVEGQQRPQAVEGPVGLHGLSGPDGPGGRPAQHGIPHPEDVGLVVQVKKAVSGIEGQTAAALLPLFRGERRLYGLHFGQQARRNGVPPPKLLQHGAPHAHAPLSLAGGQIVQQHKTLPQAQEGVSHQLRPPVEAQGVVLAPLHQAQDGPERLQFHPGKGLPHLPAVEAPHLPPGEDAQFQLHHARSHSRVIRMASSFGSS